MDCTNCASTMYLYAVLVFRLWMCGLVWCGVMWCDAVLNCTHTLVYWRFAIIFDDLKKIFRGCLYLSYKRKIREWQSLNVDEVLCFIIFSEMMTCCFKIFNANFLLSFGLSTRLFTIHYLFHLICENKHKTFWHMQNWIDISFVRQTTP